MIIYKRFNFLLKFFVAVLLIMPVCNVINPQPSQIMNAAEIKIALKKLNILGSVLYIAAHPDDENTALLSYFAKGKMMRTGYLSMTRGDGGQNLIGTEQSDELGILRTQELLAARNIDGAEQFFTRAIDFGYTKSPDETFEKWDKNKILYDVVWVIRKFKPDVIITRFPVSGEGTHGQHTASAILALEAFKIAGDSTAFPDQLEYLSAWQPKRILWNAWTPALNSMAINADTLVTVNLGEYNPLLGKSYTEIAAIARTMHKSQGFGSTGWRAEYLNQFTLMDGEPLSNDIFQGINFTWSRVPGSGTVSLLLQKAENDFDIDNPSGSLPVLLAAYRELQKLQDDYWVKVKTEELLEVIQSCSGIWVEAITNDYAFVPGNEIKAKLLIVNRSDFPFTLKSISFSTGEKINTGEITLLKGKANEFESVIKPGKDIPLTNPYWLREPHNSGFYNYDEKELIGKPENPPPLFAVFTLSDQTNDYEIKTPLLYRIDDPVKGEVYRPIEIAPPVTANIVDKVFLFPDDKPADISINLQAHENNIKGRLKLVISDGWKTEPEYVNFEFPHKYDEQFYTFKIYPPADAKVSKLSAVCEIGSDQYSYSIRTISYDHIPVQTYYPESSAKLVKLDIKKKVDKIGYIMGSGDEIPGYLSQLGYDVNILSDDDLSNNDLYEYDAIIAGVRAYNTRDRLAALHSKIVDYVSSGGTYIVQYNTTRDLVTHPGIEPFKISRDRVTVENSPVSFLNPDHQLLNFPNKISALDFDGWVQERGLYFPSEWDEKYETIISLNDPGESPKSGSVLFTRYGKGIFIYTGLSFFRQLPAGVPGAYKLFINLISAGAYEKK